MTGRHGTLDIQCYARPLITLKKLCATCPLSSSITAAYRASDRTYVRTWRLLHHHRCHGGWRERPRDLARGSALFASARSGHCRVIETPQLMREPCGILGFCQIVVDKAIQYSTQYGIATVTTRPCHPFTRSVMCLHVQYPLIVCAIIRNSQHYAVMRRSF